MKKYIIIFTLLISSISSFSQIEELPHLIIGNDILYIHPTDNSEAIEFGGMNIYIGAFEYMQDSTGEFITKLLVDSIGDNNGVPYAAKLCDTLTAFGFDDWYLPFWGELVFINNRLNLLPESLFIINSLYWSNYAIDDGGFEYNQSIYAKTANVLNFWEILSVRRDELLPCRCVRKEYDVVGVRNQNIENFNITQNYLNKELIINSVNQDITSEIIDINGKIVHTTMLEGLGEKSISYNFLNKGVYILKLTANNQVKTHKFVVE
ncbi:MAG: T9SS type A sorting domain-containing protein [Bacteroidales bacterium]|nr:T9SS type A sorting domain-containing protein [Bacteroidales bacterium]MDD4235897.1 T9SS type A sorting domain-containing protein [Bacteroidales bacterium]